MEKYNQFFAKATHKNYFRSANRGREYQGVV